MFGNNSNTSGTDELSMIEHEQLRWAATAICRELDGYFSAGKFWNAVIACMSCERQVIKGDWYTPL